MLYHSHRGAFRHRLDPHTIARAHIPQFYYEKDASHWMACSVVCHNMACWGSLTLFEDSVSLQVGLSVVDQTEAESAMTRRFVWLCGATEIKPECARPEADRRGSACPAASWAIFLRHVEIGPSFGSVGGLRGRAAWEGCDNSGRRNKTQLNCYSPAHSAPPSLHSIFSHPSFHSHTHTGCINKLGSKLKHGLRGSLHRPAASSLLNFS